MTSILEKGGGTFTGIKLLLCENPLPPINAAIAAAQAEVPRSNYYTEPYSAPLRRLLSEQLACPAADPHQCRLGTDAASAVRALWSAGASLTNLRVFRKFPAYTETPFARRTVSV
jgi:histidinol-phosphate/aromatic aminotransferase/cobyric acid decarboxylase-like protein